MYGGFPTMPQPPYGGAVGYGGPVAGGYSAYGMPQGAPYGAAQYRPTSPTGASAIPQYNQGYPVASTAMPSASMTPRPPAAACPPGVVEGELAPRSLKSKSCD